MAQAAEQARLSREKLITYGRRFLGTRYRAGGSDPGSGLDDVGFVSLVFRDAADVTLPRTLPTLHQSVRTIDPAYKEPGDILFFRLDNTSVNHVGIYIGSNQFIHSQATGVNTGVILSSLSEFYWTTRFYSAAQVLPSAINPSTETLYEVQRGGRGVEPSNQFNEGLPPDWWGPPPPPGPAREAEDGEHGDGEPSWFAEHIKVDYSFTFDWSVLSGEGAALYGRGLSVLAHARYRARIFEIGLATGVIVDFSMEIARFPLLFSVLINDSFDIYLGPVFSTQPAVIPKTSTEAKPSIFPGMIGLAWHSPPFTLKTVELRIIQDVRFSIFNNEHNNTLSASDTVSAGLSLSTGVSVRMRR
jgi:hypothetical protein